MTVAEARAMDLNFNPYRSPFNFIEIDEWIDALRDVTLERFKALEGVTNMHRLLASMNHPGAAPIDLKSISKWRFLVYVNPGTNEGDYIYFDAEFRRATSRVPAVTVSLLSAKTFGGLDHALDVSAFWTRALFVH